VVKRPNNLRDLSREIEGSPMVSCKDQASSKTLVFGIGGRTRQSPRKIDFSGLELKRGF
jgi:hypothetical protein